jgi:hypothetical protein
MRNEVLPRTGVDHTRDRGKTCSRVGPGCGDGGNPRTAAIVQVKPKRPAFFKVGKDMRERVNVGRRSTEVAATEPIKSRAPVAT